MSIRKGNFGRVYLAREKSSGRRFAIKQVSMRKSSKREKKEAIQEVAVMCQVRHPHIISYVESFADDTHVYIVMEYAEEGAFAPLYPFYQTWGGVGVDCRTAQRRFSLFQGEALI